MKRNVKNNFYLRSVHYIVLLFSLLVKIKAITALSYIHDEELNLPTCAYISTFKTIINFVVNMGEC